MQRTISHDPINEKELIATKDFIAIAPAEEEKLLAILADVKAHFEMLDYFSYMYVESDIDQFFYMKLWPLRITECI